MSHTWVRTLDDDLVRADEIRQFNISGGLWAVVVGGSHFLVAEIENRTVCKQVAEDLAAAIAETHTWREATALTVAKDDDGWGVQIQALRTTRESLVGSRPGDSTGPSPGTS